MKNFFLDVMNDMVCRNVGFTNSNCDTGFLLWVPDITIAVIVKKQQLQMQFVVLDSHARDHNGKVAADGVSVLLFFNGLNSLIDYLCNTYLQHPNGQLIPYQIQFVNCVCSMSKGKKKKGY